MTRSWVAATRLWWLGAGLAAADFMITQDVDRYNKLANDNDGFATQTFRSSDIIAPVFHVNHWDKDLTDDVPYIFIGANYNDNGAGPMIYDASDLSLVYADQSWSNAYHSEMQTIHGKKHFTFFANTHEGDHPGMRCVIVDENYNIKYEVRAVDPHRPDMHELHVTDEGTAIFTTNAKIDFDCSRWGGAKDGHVVNYGFQEVNLLTNEVLFDWKANEHDDPDDSYAKWEADSFGLNEDGEGTFDLYHYNSVRKDDDGNYLVSSRNYCHIKLIDGKTGDDIWVLGGKKNQFEDLSGGNATNFCWQHNARFIGDHTQITLFDNHSLNQGDCGDGEGMDPCVTRGLQLELNYEEMTVRIVHEYYHPEHINSGAMGGMQKLNSGNSIIGWGWSPAITEFTDDGRIAMDVQRGILGIERQNNMFAYRVFKSHWTGRPTWAPSMAADKGDFSSQKATFFMSWNGATDIKKWALFSSRDSRQVDVMSNGHIAEVDRTGFETSAEVSHDDIYRYVVAVALDKDGKVMGTSDVYDMGTDFAKQIPEEEADTKPDEKVNVDVEEVPEVDASESVVDEYDSSSAYSNMGYAGAGAAFGGFVVVAGGASLATFLFFRRRRTQSVKRETKYAPVMTEEQP